MRLILLGPPGAGKGTQASRICDALDVIHVSTGDLLRDAVSRGTELGVEAAGYMDKGNLVPDSLVLALVGERLARSDADAGFLLDGFPRNRSQAEALAEQLSDGKGVELVVHMRLEDEEIVRRLLERGRKDDNEAVIRNRLEVYRGETAPLIEYFEDLGLLRTVDALGTMDEVFARMQQVVLRVEAGQTGEVNGAGAGV